MASIQVHCIVITGGQEYDANAYFGLRSVLPTCNNDGGGQERLKSAFLIAMTSWIDVSVVKRRLKLFSATATNKRSINDWIARS
jgi:hypothetical protein